MDFWHLKKGGFISLLFLMKMIFLRKTSTQWEANRKLVAIELMIDKLMFQFHLIRFESIEN